MKNSEWARLLAYATGLVNQQLLLKNEHLAAENRILRASGAGRQRGQAGYDLGLIPPSDRPEV